MSRGLTLKLSDVAGFGKQARLFSGRPIMITGTMTHVRDFYYYNGKKVELKSCEMSLESVFSQIKRVTDESGIVIAERLNPRAALISTGKGNSKKIKRLQQEFVQQLVEIAN